MSFKVEATPNFLRESKQLSKKYLSLKKDLENLFLALSKNPTLGSPLGAGVYKIRMAITAKGKGKSGGARIITCFRIIKSTVYLVSIYDKSETESLKDADIRALIKKLPL